MGGGALFCWNDSSYISHCLFKGNFTLGGKGGAINLNFVKSCVIVNSLFTGNQSPSASVIYNRESFLEIYSSTISGNTGIYAAIYHVGSTSKIYNSILWGNAEEISGKDAWAVEIFNSIVQGGYEGINILDEDPLFVSPVEYSEAPTIMGDYNLQENSPAIGAGDESFLPPDRLDINQNNDFIEKVPLDLKESSRVLDGGLDLGSFEYIDEVNSAYIEEVNLKRSTYVNISPNPYKNQLHLNTNYKSSEILIYNALGKIIMNNKYEDCLSNYIIETGIFEPGAYIINIKKDQQIVLKKIMIKL